MPNGGKNLMPQPSARKGKRPTPLPPSKLIAKRKTEPVSPTPRRSIEHAIYLLELMVCLLLRCAAHQDP